MLEAKPSALNYNESCSDILLWPFLSSTLSQAPYRHHLFEFSDDKMGTQNPQPSPVMGG